MITGMLSPDLKNACYPAGLYEEIKKQVPGYSVEALPLLNKAEYVRNIEESINARTDLGLYLLGKYDPDVFVMVFTELDRLQHFFWADMDPRHPMHTETAPDIERAIEFGYTALDRAVGRLSEVVDENTLILLLSDHGFEGVFKIFYVNKWLEDRGYLRVKHRQTDSFLNDMKRGLQSVGLWKLVRRLRSKVLKAPRLRSENLSYAVSIDWKHTTAAFGPNLGININKKGRESQGIVSLGEEYQHLCNRLREELEAYRDPETGERVVDKVVSREEVYTGDQVEFAPDLRLIMAKSEHYQGQYAYSPKIGVPDALTYPDKIYGNHDEHGIFVISGPGIRSGLRLNGARMVDVAPTILRVMGLPTSGHMDGRPLCEAFNEIGMKRFMTDEQEQRGARSAVFERNVLEEVTTDEQESRVIERLRDLGYLD
jgi:predicted AlkP superfamily phosphohydrolase/phosphomutase